MKPSERDAAHSWGTLDAARRTRDMMRGISYDALLDPRFRGDDAGAGMTGARSVRLDVIPALFP
jgi:hypothetical protein